jgi:hypothetical protein
MLEILRRKSMGCSSDIQFKHSSSGVDVRERNVDTFLESERQRLADRMSDQEDSTKEEVYAARGGKGGVLASRGKVVKRWRQLDREDGARYESGR